MLNKNMDSFLILLLLASLVAAALGTLNPKWVLWGGQPESRKRVLLIYGIPFMVLFAILLVIVEPQQDDYLIPEDEIAQDEDGSIKRPISNSDRGNVNVETSNSEAPEVKNQVSEKHYKVNRVVDGDTIDVSSSEKEVRIRLIGVDTPETVHPNNPVECFGREASSYLSNLLLGKTVFLEEDETQGDVDRFGRLLRYVVLVDGRNVNKLIITEGYGHEYTYRTAYRYQSQFRHAEREAELNERGLWAPDACPDESAQETKQNGSGGRLRADTAPSSTECTIKGNISSKGEKIYHTEGCKSYKRTKIDPAGGERYFCTEKEAVDAGWRKAGNC